MVARRWVWLLVVTLGCTFDRAHLPGGAVTGDPSRRGQPPGSPIVPTGLDATVVPDDQDAAVTPPSDGSRAADGRPAVDARSNADTRPPPADAPPAPDLAPPPDTRVPDAPPDLPPIFQVPAGCRIVGCDGVSTNHGCCTAWYNFGLESEDRNQVQRDDLVRSFSAGAADIRAEYAFDRAGQDGAVGMLMDRSRPVRAIRLVVESAGAAVGRPFVSAEATDGRSGCAYPLGAGGQADTATPLFCWGDPAFVPDRINVRLEATAPGPASVRVTTLEVR